MDKYKIKIASLILLILLGVTYAIYQFSGLSDEFTIKDKDALIAIQWLHMADEKQFTECKKNTAPNADKWFQLFQENRESLGESISRKLKSKTKVKKDIYKIIFTSAFSKTKKIDETVWISKDAKVWQVKYSYLRMPSPNRRSKDFGTYSENGAVQKVANQTISAIKSLNVEFFDQITLRNERFRAGKRIIKNIKQQHEKTGEPFKYQLVKTIRYTRGFPGRSELTSAIVYINCLYKIKKQLYRRNIALILYINTSIAKPRWEVYRFSFGRLRQQKRRKSKAKK